MIILQVFHTVSIIAEYLCKLHASGCVNFIGWEYTFKMESGSLDALQNELKYLSQQLEFWEEALRKSREECYLLNTFTAKQILTLRKELKIVTQSEHAEAPLCLNLLRNIFPCLSIEDIISKTQSSELHHVNPQNEAFEEQPDVFIPSASAVEVKYFSCEDIVEKCFSENEKKIYLGLTSTYGFDELSAVAKVIQSEANSESTNVDRLIESIGEEMIEGNEETLDKESLTVMINEYLKKIQVNACFEMDGDTRRVTDASRLFSESPEETSDLEPSSVDKDALSDLSKEDIVFGM